MRKHGWVIFIVANIFVAFAIGVLYAGLIAPAATGMLSMLPSPTPEPTMQPANQCSVVE